MVILLIAGAVVSAFTILAELAELMLPPFGESQEVGENPAGFIVLMLQFGLGLLTVFIFIATVIVFCMWLYRCSENLRAFGYWRSQIGHSAGWAVGSFFVPIANLFVPYQATKEVWQKSRPSNSEMFSLSDSPPGFFSAWWAFWLLSNFASNAYFRMVTEHAPREATAIVGIISEVLSIGAVVFAIKVVKEITRLQEETSLVVKSALPGPPPPPDFGSPAGATNQRPETPLSQSSPSTNLTG